MRFQHLLTNLTALVPASGHAGDASVTVRRDWSIGMADGRIVAVGPTAELRGRAESGPVPAVEPAASAWPSESDSRGDPGGVRVEDLGGRLVTPALVDCHTHLVFGGGRSGEWARRLAGASYEEIAREGGGILSTVAATRAASVEELTAAAARRMQILAAGGVGTVEVKSGYGLDRETELRMLEAALAAGRRAGLKVVRTLLAAHAVPPEYADRADAYLDQVCIPLVHEAAGAGLADAVDAFCETIAFSPEQVSRLFEAARQAGLPVRLHADQLNDLGGAALAARHGALSADHLEYTSADAAARMSEAGTTAVLLPGAFFHLKEGQRPPVDAFRSAGTHMAVATDANPGSSPILSLTLAANMACTLFGLTVEEAWAGITVNGARAVGREEDVGSIAIGCSADLAVWTTDDPAEVLQWMGHDLLQRRMRNGTWV